MTWKSRENEAPPPQFFADVIGYLRRAFPKATLTREAVAQLTPYLMAEWQNGQSARNAAKATCACDGQRITVSPAATVQMPRRAVLPPPDAKRGTTFGIDELRERREVGKLRAQAAVEERHAEYQEARRAQLEQERSALTSDGKTKKAERVERQAQAAEAARKTHGANATRLRQEANTLARERGFWIPPAAETRASEEAVKKKIGAPRTPRTEAVMKEVPRQKAAPKASGKKKCDVCTEPRPAPADLSALVDEFVDAAMKDEGN